MTLDSRKLAREAQRPLVEVAHGVGSPPSYGGWRPCYDAKVDRIELAPGAKHNKATIWFPDRRWNDREYTAPPRSFGDKVRITISGTVVFSGFIVNYISDFTGGDRQGSSHERNAIVCYDFRWLLSVTSPVFGCYARGPDDYDNYGTDSQSARNSSTFLSGQRAIFNYNSKPNRDATAVVGSYAETPIFTDPDNGDYWTARQMICYILAPVYNQVYAYTLTGDPADLPGLDDDDFAQQINDVCVDGLSILEAIELVASSLGWTFREDYYSSGLPLFVFYKPGSASGYTRQSHETILHRLHAPYPGEDISAAVESGAKMLWSMNLSQDIGKLINQPWGLGAPEKFEITAELVPAWLDADLSPDTDNLYFTDAELQDETNPNQYDYYKYYYPRGSSFKRDVGRKWSLNEAGRYTAGSYDRGAPFDFADVIPAEFIIDSATGKKLFAPLNRQLLPALTVDANTLNSIGIKLEVSFDGGSTWQPVNASVSNLQDECGIYIDEANLAEITDQAEGELSGGTLDGEQLNLWTSLCDDKLNSRSYKDGNWQTRIRATFSVQLDQRIRNYAQRRPTSGSPFPHSQIYDFSDKYKLQRRTESSIYDDTGKPAWEIDSDSYFDTHLQRIRESCEDTSVSGQFTLDRIWPGTFKCGDCIEHITGRDYSLAASVGETDVYPEIVKIIILPDRQKEKLITRDLRFAEVTLI